MASVHTDVKSAVHSTLLFRAAASSVVVAFAISKALSKNGTKINLAHIQVRCNFELHMRRHRVPTHIVFVSRYLLRRSLPSLAASQSPPSRLRSSLLGVR
jgi:hypothetical protein